MHQHISCSKPFARTKYALTIESGEEPAIIDLLRKTCMRKDGTYMDKLSKKLRRGSFPSLLPTTLRMAATKSPTHKHQLSL
ncbi:putative transposase Ptta/En/Spm plant [Arabidopsis thaliana x Arabidopsis arenosa]|uniref:Putative transposase Ptta/En/Spm plant n=1 Tax=Arabidopsis thaliana x Arabidopsis arenosa TaxID=1240361 RepID=A0A8T1ZKS3_9BRAS|nr:putative transposase Ptta/En/Spm plant [Arabidopsis thaliana x Arabidopsis arenosa]KAG7559957.1 putative transposase Ptta/En/Spm plant [Arabidopsis thaliana x Arabidopsis arenosa]KAG7559958.1 putative transposase Ptta/En/Spm plant [Arabidopsis thaliana x Arabidopsis arenosa]